MSDLYMGFSPKQNIKKRLTKHTYRKRLLIETFEFGRMVEEMYDEGTQTTGSIYLPLFDSLWSEK